MNRVNQSQNAKSFFSRFLKTLVKIIYFVILYPDVIQKYPVKQNSLNN